MQQRLRGRFSVGTAGYVRYVYAIPVGAVLLAAYWTATGGALPPPNAGVLLGYAAAGLAQVLGMSLLIMAFRPSQFRP